MPCLPIVERELRVRSRQPATYWARCGIAALAALVGLQSVMFYSRPKVGPSSGSTAFLALAWVGLALAVASAAATADCLSRERREGTLGLLFLTDLRGYDVVLGKLTAVGVASFYALIGFVPPMALALVEGGVTGPQVLKTGLALLNLIFVSLAIGLCVSSRAYEQYPALRKTFLWLLALLILPWLATLLLKPLAQWLGVLTFLSPYLSFQLATNPLAGGTLTQFCCSLVVIQLEGWGLLFGAGMFLARSWDQPERYRARLPELPFVTRSGPPRAPAARTELLEKNPISWLAWRMYAWRVLVWTGAALMLLGASGFPAGFFIRGVRPMGFGFYGVWLGLSVSLNLSSAAVLAWAAGRLFFDARRNGELELVLATPLGAKVIIEGYWWALWRHLRGPLLLALFVIFLQILFSAGGAYAMTSFFSLITKALDVVAVCWVAMWFGLRARKLFSVVNWTVGLVIILPAIATYLLINVPLVLSSGFPRARITSVFWWGTSGPLFSILKDIILIRWAAGRLRAELRTGAPLAVGEWLR